MNNMEQEKCTISFYERKDLEKIFVHSLRVAKETLIKYRKDSLKLQDKNNIIYNSIAKEKKFRVPFSDIYDLTISKEALDFLEKNNFHTLKQVNMESATDEDIYYYNNYINDGLSLSNGSLLVTNEENIENNNYYILSKEDYDIDNVRKGIIRVPRNLYLLHLLYKHDYKLLDNQFVKTTKKELNELFALFDEYDVVPLYIKDINDRQKSSRIKYKCERDKEIIKYLK